MESAFYFEAIDPMALVLSPAAYRIWWEKHHPHVPKVAEIQEVIRSMSPDERRAALDRARMLAAYGKVMEEALSAL